MDLCNISNSDSDEVRLCPQKMVHSDNRMMAFKSFNWILEEANTFVGQVWQEARLCLFDNHLSFAIQRGCYNPSYRIHKAIKRGS